MAVLGFKNLSGKPDEAWISTALAEMLSTELAAGEQVRTIPGENIARMKVDLALADADSFGQDSLAKIRNHLGTDLVVVGSYLAMGKTGGGKIRLDFRLQDAVVGETIASVSETGTESVEQMPWAAAWSTDTASGFSQSRIHRGRENPLPSWWSASATPARKPAVTA